MLKSGAESRGRSDLRNRASALQAQEKDLGHVGPRWLQELSWTISSGKGVWAGQCEGHCEGSQGDKER